MKRILLALVMMCGSAIAHHTTDYPVHWSSNHIVNGVTYFIGPNANLTSQWSGQEGNVQPLSNTDLTGADLSNADFRGNANQEITIQNTCFDNVNFQGANISNVNFIAC